MELALLITFMTVAIVVGAGCIWIFRGWLQERDTIMRRYLKD